MIFPGNKICDSANANDANNNNELPDPTSETRDRGTSLYVEIRLKPDPRG